MFENPWDNNTKAKNNSQKPFADKRGKVFNFFQNNQDPGIAQKPVLIFLATIFFLYWVSTGFFTIDADEQGIVMRFGKYARDVSPGLHYKFPSPIETVEKVSVTRIKRDIVGKITNPISNKRYLNSENESDLSYPKESQILTGDENIIDVHFYIQWRIDDAKDYLFNIREYASDNIVKSAAESIMREVMGTVNISQALSEKRLDIENSVKSRLQKVLDSYHSGIKVMSVGVLYSYVAPEVRDAYRDVQSAKADRERFINQAQAYRNEIIPKAHGKAQSIIEGAMGYKKAVISKAEGDAEKFLDIYKSYAQNKEVTSKRMYIDTMEEIYKNNNKILVDKDLAKGVLPYLSLDKLNK